MASFPKITITESTLTRREQFAAMAMQGLLANPSVHSSGITLDETAQEALQYTDALISALTAAEEKGDPVMFDDDFHDDQTSAAAND